MPITLHVFPPTPRAIKVLALNHHLGLGAEIRVVNYFQQEQRTPEFAALNPNRRMPVLTEDDGFVLWESNAILLYLASKKPEAGLWPTDARGQADVMRWLAWESSHWDPACDQLIGENIKKPAFGGGTPDAATVAAAEASLTELAAVLDAQLQGRAWVTGERLTLADFALGAWMHSATPAAYPLAGRENIARWYAALSALPGWQQALPVRR